MLCMAVKHCFFRREMHRVHDCSVQWLVSEENIAADTLKTSIQFPHSIIPISFCTLQNFLNLNIKSHGNISLVPVWTLLSPVLKSADTTVLGTSSWQLRAVILTITSQAAALPSRRAERRWVASFRGNTDFPRGRSGFFFCQHNQTGNCSSCKNKYASVLWRHTQVEDTASLLRRQTQHVHEVSSSLRHL